MNETHQWTDPDTGHVAGYVNGILVCVCGSERMRLLTRGAAPMIDHEGPFVTYGIWECRNCGQKWWDDEDEFTPYDEEEES